MNHHLRIILSLFCAVIFSGCTKIVVDFADTPSQTLEDTIIIVSAAGDPPRQTYILGDVDLATLRHKISQVVSSDYTHWWLLGHIGNNTVFSSTTDLTGIDLLAVEPYDAYYPYGTAVPTNLDAYVNGTTYSIDWWATTVNNHHSHVATNNTGATLWEFDSTGTNIGTVNVNLRASASSSAP